LSQQSAGDLQPKMDIVEFNTAGAGAPQALHMVSDNLWLGNREGASDAEHLQNLGITHVVNAMAGDPGPAGILAGDVEIPTSNVCNVMVADTTDAAGEMAEEFRRVSDWVKAALDNDGKVLIHCERGTSRSVSLVIAFLMKYKDKSLRDALAGMVDARRPQVCGQLADVYTYPNAKFFLKLQALEKDIFGSDTSMTMRDFRNFKGL